MKTEELITSLVSDHRPVGAGWIERASFANVLIGVLSAIGIVAATIGFRHDLLHALETGRIVAKYAFMLTMLVISGHLFARLSRPGRHLSDEAIVFAVPMVFIILAALVQLALYGAPTRSVLIGDSGNWIACMAIVPVLAIVPFVGLVYVLRRSAPTDIRGAGIATGIFATSIGATVYASHCPCDTPIFVAIWYPLAFIIGALAGRAIVPLLVRW